MILVKADTEHQRLIFTVDQEATEADFIDILARMDQEIPKLKKGWVMRADFRGLRMVDPSLSKYIPIIQQKVFEGGAKKVGTLLDSFVLKVQIERGGKEVDPHYTARRFDDEAAWEKYLSEP